MNIVIAHLGPISHIIPATSVHHAIKRNNIETNIIWVVSEDYKYFLKYNKNVKKVISMKQFCLENRKYDLLINLWPFFPEVKINGEVQNFMGFSFCSEFDIFQEGILDKKRFENMNIFQLYYNLCGLTWRGEGYDIPYYPRSKQKKNRIGISVSNANLRNYVLDNLEIDNGKKWYVPYKKNIFKRMDEINYCEKIITDDLIVFHLSMALKKYVYFLDTYPKSFKLEMFGRGEMCSVPSIYCNY